MIEVYSAAGWVPVKNNDAYGEFKQEFGFASPAVARRIRGETVLACGKLYRMNDKPDHGGKEIVYGQEQD